MKGGRQAALGNKRPKETKGICVQWDRHSTLTPNTALAPAPPPPPHDLHEQKQVIQRTGLPVASARCVLLSPTPHAALSCRVRGRILLSGRWYGAVSVICGGLVGLNVPLPSAVQSPKHLVADLQCAGTEVCFIGNTIAMSNGARVACDSVVTADSTHQGTMERIVKEMFAGYNVAYVPRPHLLNRQLLSVAWQLLSMSGHVFRVPTVWQPPDCVTQAVCAIPFDTFCIPAP